MSGGKGNKRWEIMSFLRLKRANEKSFTVDFLLSKGYQCGK